MKRDELKTAFNSLTVNMAGNTSSLPGNPKIEKQYLQYQAAAIDAHYADVPSAIKSINQLPAREQEQVGKVAARLIDLTSLPADLVKSRLDRMRIIELDTVTLRGKEVGGKYDRGLAAISLARPDAMQNHAKLHEIGHGLQAIGKIALFGDYIGDFGSGLFSRARPISSESLNKLRLAQEAMVDSLVLPFCDVDTDEYLAGAFPDIGYWQEDNALAIIAADTPELYKEMYRASFVTNLESKDQGDRFADAFSLAMERSR